MNKYKKQLKTIQKQRKEIEGQIKELRAEIQHLDNVDKSLFETAKGIHAKWQKEDYESYKKQYPYTVI